MTGQTCVYCFVLMQIRALPHIQKTVAAARNTSNRTLGVLEPWQIAACAVCFTLTLVWIYEFLFNHDESMSLLLILVRNSSTVLWYKFVSNITSVVFCEIMLNASIVVVVLCISHSCGGNPKMYDHDSWHGMNTFHYFFYDCYSVTMSNCYGFTL